jgi:hypothetical protein
MGEVEDQKWAENLREYLINDEGTEVFKDLSSNWRDMPLRNDVIQDVIRGCDAAYSGLREAFDEQVMVSGGTSPAEPVSYVAFAWTRGFSLAILDVLYSINPAQALKACESLAIRKHHDYGSENILNYAEIGVIVRLSDKILRVKNLLKTAGTANFESITDTLYDAVVYATYAMILEDDKWIS